MRHAYFLRIPALIGLCCAAPAHAQEPLPSAAVPKVVRFNGSFHSPNSPVVPSVESVILAVYSEQTGGAPLWQEIQNVSVEANGGYSVLMGATLNGGIPVELFRAGEPRWLGVQFNRPGEIEQPRVLLASVPYALKSADAETLGGRPASAYLLAETPANVTSPTGTPALAGSANPVSTNAVKPRASAGSVNFVGKFVDATNLGNSSIYDANGAVGIGTTTPTAKLELSGPTNSILRVNGAAPGAAFIFNSQTGMGQDRATLGVNAFFNGNWNLVNTQEPSWLLQLRTAEDDFGILRAAPGASDFANHELLTVRGNGNVGIGTSTPGSKLDVAGAINLTGNLKSGGNAVLQLGQLGADNIGLGLATLGLNTTGIFNTALGMNALQSNTTGNQNTATGFLALGNNSSGTANTANGNSALSANTTGSNNTAHGDHSLYANTTGSSNTATGQGTLFSNTIGTENTANGYLALLHNISDSNTATGAHALESNVVGAGNSAYGTHAMDSHSVGSYNTAVGYYALELLTSGSDNIAIRVGSGGSLSGFESSNIDIGNFGTPGDNGVIRIGSGNQVKFFAAGIRSVTTGLNDGVAVLIDSRGQLGTANSSRRFKEDIVDMGDSSHGLMDLRPVTFRYKQPYDDGSKPIQYGLIAEEVAEVYPDLVAHSADGQVETVKYQVLDSMLLNEVQRQQAEIRRLEKAIKEQSQTFGERLARLEAALASHSGASNDANVH